MIHDFLNNLPNIPLALGIVAFSIATSAGLVWLTHKFLDLDVLEQHNTLTGYVYQMGGVIYAVMLAFAVFVVWTQFQDTSNAVEHEANALVSVYNAARGLPVVMGGTLRARVTRYAEVVVEDEWERMAVGRGSDASGMALEQLADFERDYAPANEREQTIYANVMSQIEQLNTYRRLRLQASRGQIPPPMWVLLIGGALFTVAFTALLGARNFRLHLLLTALLAAGLGFTLFIILAMDTPYTGSFRVTPAPFRDALSYFERAP